MTLPAHIVEMSARLPAGYEQARQALEACVRIDECKDWADKAEALASYARQADDHSLMDYAMRVKARAVRRAGELLKEFDGRGDHMKKGGAPLSRRDAADHARMSPEQQKQAVRVASVPLVDFETAVEATPPATVTTLAEAGIKARPVLRPPGFEEATRYMGAIGRLAEFCEQYPPGLIAGALMPHEIEKVYRDSEAVAIWLNDFVYAAKGE